MNRVGKVLRFYYDQCYNQTVGEPEILFAIHQALAGEPLILDAVWCSTWHADVCVYLINMKFPNRGIEAVGGRVASPRWDWAGHEKVSVLQWEAKK